MFAAALLVCAYLVVVLAAGTWIARRGRGTGVNVARTAVAAATFAVLLVAAALVWQIPITAQQRVDLAATMPLGSAAPRLPCDRVKDSLALVERSSGGTMTIDEDGDLRIAAATWGQLNGRPREMLIDFSAQVKSCRGAEAASGTLIVRDIKSGEVLEAVKVD
jgi:hypothetical protein